MEHYLVSIRWGKGFHYFVTPEPVKQVEALGIARSHVKRLNRLRAQNKRGAKPIVYVLRITRHEELD